ncbi:MAG: DUF1116 domain-containing protein [Betaproteobacteria bacterium]|jgi:hypothetical protein
MNLDPLRRSRPVWNGLAFAGEALGLGPRMLLHAGPPFASPGEPSAPVLSSAVLACRHEGWASTDEEAENLIRSDVVRLLPAQDFGAVTPLAEVVSPSTPLTRVADLGDPSTQAWAPLSSGSGPQMRFGTRNPAVLARHAWREQTLFPALRAALAEPVELLEPARQGLDRGDDLHGSTACATTALAEILDRRLGTDTASRETRAMLAQSPLFFLTLWMAACRVMMLAAADSMPTVLLALAGNGKDVGILLGGDPSAWTRVGGAPPEGELAHGQAPAEVCPMIGDSGVIDIAGFGGQRLRDAPAARCLETRHPGLDARVGLDARTLVAKELQPQVHIGMIGADGRTGLMGRGLYRPPLALFRAAITDRTARTTPR